VLHKTVSFTTKEIKKKEKTLHKKKTDLYKTVGRIWKIELQYYRYNETKLQNTHPKEEDAYEAL